MNDDENQPSLFDIKESFLYDPEDEVLFESLTSDEKQLITVTTRNQYSGANRDNLKYQIMSLKAQLKTVKDRKEKAKIKMQIKVLKTLLSSSEKVNRKLKIKEE